MCGCKGIRNRSLPFLLMHAKGACIEVSLYPIFAEQHELLSESFPYVLWRLTPPAYHILHLPAASDRQVLLPWLSGLTRSLKRRCALVLSATECVYFESDGSHAASACPPTGGIAFSADIAVPQVPC